MKIKTIETDRLYLRGFRKEDAKFALSIWNDPEMGKYLSDPYMEEIDEKYLKMVEALGDDEECCHLIAEFKDAGERIGTCSFIKCFDGEIYDIAYCVHKKYWRKGYATEMILGMCDYAKEQGVKKIKVCVDKKNIASNAVMKKLRFNVTKESTYKKGYINEICEEYVYELIL